jgi:hypothetical protein
LSEKAASLSDVVALPLGDIYSETLSNTAALLALSTGLVGGASRYGAVLADRTEREIERATAIGFFLGLALALLTLASEYAS